MTHVVKDICIKCKYTDCVDVCPVDCFHEGENMLVIDPDECIDCALCVPECPVDAIVMDNEADAEAWLVINAEYSKKWPLIVAQKDPLAAADKWKDIENKMQDHFDPRPFQKK